MRANYLADWTRKTIQGLDSAEAREQLDNFVDEIKSEIELVRGASHKFNLELFSQGKLTPVFFGSAINNYWIVGAVGTLQFEVVAHRLLSEYNVNCVYEGVSVTTARWVYCEDSKKLEEFKRKCEANLALDAAGQLTYIAPTMVNLSLTQERYPDIIFTATREY